jgi:putative transposase
VLLQKFSQLRKHLSDRHEWARGYLAVSSRTIPDKMIEEYIGEQEGNPIHDNSQFTIDEITKLLLPRR